MPYEYAIASLTKTPFQKNGYYSCGLSSRDIL